MRREVIEEAGLVVANLLPLGRAIEFIESIKERQYFEKQCHFFAAVVEREGHATETDVELLWLDPADAISVFHHQSHAWAVGVYQHVPRLVTCHQADERFCRGRNFRVAPGARWTRRPIPNATFGSK